MRLAKLCALSFFGLSTMFSTFANTEDPKENDFAIIACLKFQLEDINREIYHAIDETDKILHRLDKALVCSEVVSMMAKKSWEELSDVNEHVRKLLSDLYAEQCYR